MHESLRALTQKIKERSAVCAVIGLGYVGLPLAVEIAGAGFRAVGIDVSRQKTDAINAGRNYIRDVDDARLSELVAKKRLSATSDFSALAECDFISICVPTPLGKGKDPDMSYIVQVAAELKKYLRPGQVVILESTTYPGTTEEIVQPTLQQTGLKAGEDFHLAFSPERIDPGNPKFGLRNTPKIVGGVTHACTEIVKSYYGTFVERVFTVSSPRAAEMVKILENTFRAINIGLANEVAIMCNQLGIDTWEVIDAASTKPFGFMPFYPGPGLGGHCIPVDPHYLVWKMKLMNYNARFIQLADEINSSMPHLVVEKITAALNDYKKPVKESKVLILGVAYKSDIDDCRESPALDVIKLLQERGADVSYHDPYVPSIQVDGHRYSSVPNANLGVYDCVALLTNHSSFDARKIVSECQLIVDTRNATKGIQGQTGQVRKIVKL